MSAMVKIKLSLYGATNSSKGPFAISIVSSFSGKLDPAEEITVRLQNHRFNQSSIFKPLQKGRKRAFHAGKAGKLVQQGLCISRVSISGNSKLDDPHRSSKFSISGAFAAGGDNAPTLPDDIYFRVVENGFTDSIKQGDLAAKKGRYGFKAKREGITSLLIAAAVGTFRISSASADMRNADGNPVEIVLEIGNDKREVNVDMMKKGKKLVY